MSSQRSCPRCGEPLLEAALEGLCPRCLLAGGITSGDGLGGPRVLPPALSEVQEALLDLEVLELLGHGGMGSVYKARQPRLNRIVAVKVLPPAAAENPEFPARFQREAEVLARLNHPNIVTIHDFGESGGLYYFVMEYVEGATLADLIKGRKIAPSMGLSVVGQICDALQYAHDQGTVHRDIKPGNILVNRDGRVKVTDFGLVKIMAAGVDDLFLTFANQTVGTPLYMAPEQRDNPLEVDQRADIYSLGVVFYELLTGTLPSGRFAPPSQKAGTDERLDPVVLRALEADPQRRYRAANEVKSDLESAARPAAIAPEDRGLAPPQRRRVTTRAVATSTLLVLAALLGFLLWPDPWRHPAPAGRLIAVGSDVFGELEATPASLEDVVATTFDGEGGGHGLVLLKNGKVLAFGRNDDGQCEVPDDLTHVMAIAQGEFHSMALRANGTVAAWGRDDHGETDVPYGLRNVVAIAAANQHSAALTADGDVVLWGDNYGGKLTNARCNERVVAIECGAFHVVGLTESGRAVAWGDNEYGACNVPSEATNLLSVAAGRGFSVALRQDGKLLFWGDSDRRTFAAPTGKDFTKVKARGRMVGALARDGTVALWGEGEHIEVGRIHGVLDFSPAWYHCAFIVGSDPTALPPRPQPVHIPPVTTFGLHAQSIVAMELVRGGTALATASGMELRIYDLASRRLERSLKHTSPIWALDWSESRRLIVCGADDGSVLVYDDSDDDSKRAGAWSAVIPPSHGAVTAVCFSPKGDLLLTGHSQGEVVLWGHDTNGQFSVTETVQEHTQAVTDFVFLPGEDQVFFSGGWDGTADRGVYRWRVPVSASEHLEMVAPALGWRWRVQSLACRSDGLLAIGEWDGRAALSNTANARPAAWFQAHFAYPENGVRWLDDQDGHSVAALAFTPDGRHLVTGGGDATVRVWRIGLDEMTPVTRVAELSGFTKQVRAVVVTADGARLIASGQENLLSVFDLSGLLR